MKGMKRFLVSVLMVFGAHWVLMIGIWTLLALVRMGMVFYSGSPQNWTINMEYLFPLTLAVAGLFMFVIWPVKNIMVFVTDMNKEYSAERFLFTRHTIHVTAEEFEQPGFVDGKIRELRLRYFLDVIPAVGVYWFAMLLTITICQLIAGNGAKVIGVGLMQIFTLSILPFLVMGVLYRFSFTSRLARWYQS
jgi:hypothetical protein